MSPGKKHGAKEAEGPPCCNQIKVAMSGGASSHVASDPVQTARGQEVLIGELVVVL